MAEGREDAVLNVLNPEVFVDAEVLHGGVEGNQKGAGKKGVENGGLKVALVLFLGEVAGEDDKEQGVVNGGDKAAVEA